MTREVRRHYVTASEIDRRRWEQAVRETEAELPELIRLGEQIAAAKAQPTLCGALRRAFHRSDERFRFDEFAGQLRVAPVDLNEWLAGQQSLPSDVLDRMAILLRLELVPMPTLLTQEVVAQEAAV